MDKLIWSIFALLTGLLFFTGRGIVFGFTGVEPTTLMFPQSDFAGWLFVGLCVLWIVPSWMVARSMRAVKGLKKNLKSKSIVYKEKEVEIGN